MESEPANQRERVEQRATAFVFGELEREEATEFMKAMDTSPSIRALVDSIRDAVGALESEFEENTRPVNDAARLKIQNAIDSQAVEAPPVVTPDGHDGSRRWAAALAVAASLLLACGLTLPGLNQVIRANTDTAELKNQIKQIELRNGRLEAENQSLAEQLAVVRSDLQRIAAVRSSFGSTGSIDSQDVATRVPESGSTGPSDDAPKGEATSSENIAATSDGPTRSDDRPVETPAAVGAESVDEGSRSMPARLAVDEGEVRGQSADDSPRTSGEATVRNSAGAASGVGVIAMDETKKPALPIRSKPILGQVLPERSGRRAATNRRPDPSALALSDSVAGDDMTMEMMDESAGGMSMTEGAGGGLWMMPEAYRRNWGDRFAGLDENRFESAAESPLSTFPAGGPTGAYAKVRTSLTRQKKLPDPSTIRIEQLVNFFDYHYEPPADDRPFAASIDIAECPWNPRHRLARIGIKGRVIENDRPASNLVFLVDVSGSMNRPDKLPAVIDGIKALTNRLDGKDSLAILVYSGADGLVLDATRGDRKKAIFDALDRLKAGGPTDDGKGIRSAYAVAKKHFIEGGINRVILCSDGDFDVGLEDSSDLVKLAEDHAAGELYLTVLRFGEGKHDEALMEEIVERAEADFAVIGNDDDARRQLVEQLHGSWVSIAKNLRIRVEFNPMEVQSYRLIGYGNRPHPTGAVRDREEDADEIVAGHTVTALFEIIPRQSEAADGDERMVAGGLKYQQKIHFSEAASSGEMLTLNLSYTPPAEEQSRRIEFAIKDVGKRFDETDSDFQFAASVAAFGMLLRHSPFKGNASFEMVREIASAAAVDDRTGYRDEFVALVGKAKKLAGG